LPSLSPPSPSSLSLSVSFFIVVVDVVDGRKEEVWQVTHLHVREKNKLQYIQNRELHKCVSLREKRK
jgi:hypothetical protein